MEIRLHVLRHFHASVMLQSGQSWVTVSRRLGHASASITADVYAHSMPGWQKEAANAFAKAMQEGSAEDNVGKMSAIQGDRQGEMRNTDTDTEDYWEVVPRDRLELSTPAFSVPCSTT